MERPRPALALAVALPLLACAAPEVDTTDDATTAGSSTTSPASSAADPTSESETTGTTAPIEPDLPWEPIRARGITLTNVSANQGVDIDIGKDGVGVPGDERNAYLLQGRITAIRGYWQVEDDWEPRAIEARLELVYEDGETVAQSKVVTIEEDSFVGLLSRSFVFGLMPEEVRPGLRYRMELWETGPGQEDRPEPEPAPAIPLVGTEYVGVEKSDQSLEIVVIPFHYNVPGCDTTPAVDEDQLQGYDDAVFQMNPADRMTLTLHEPVEWTEPLDSFTPLNVYMSSLRAEEGAGDHVFYYGLIDPCAFDLDGFGGLAHAIPTIPPIKEEAFVRVASGLSLSDQLQWTGETFVHELGHLLGRRHVKGGCGASGTDPAYPYPNGEIDGFGFGVRDFKLYDPFYNKSYMTYCHPYWVSSWGWNMVYKVIEELTKWAAEDAPGEPDGRVLVGAYDSHGAAIWYVTRGGVPAARLAYDQRVRFLAGEETLVEQPAAVYPMSHGSGRLVVTPLPPAFEQTTRVVHEALGVVVDAPKRAEIREGTLRRAAP
ncbi:MAG: hypothetical protein KC636_23780 [Myxococcales bacterium]|nr:hypothetical protein [Myxococcales bacterium]